MCKVSEKIRFCTCKISSIAELKHYWVLHRFIEGQEIMAMGAPVLPYGVDEQTERYNKSFLLQRVNEPDAFDVALDLHEGDRLQITFTCKGNRLSYGFEYRKRKWVEEDYDSPQWLWHHQQTEFGSLKPALEK